MNDEHNLDDDGDDGVDPVLVAILEQLWRAYRETPDREWSLAKLSKQAGVPMSGLRRQLTALVDSGLVVTTLAEDGTGRASLSDDGRTFCAEVFGNATP
ncbi:helix-turn-helix transcriptional regulator [Paraburkholderia sp. Ac-20340]|uniref:helix-turn-helix domain-containing protein n=1 Tax=Paraburkholderia sp. Ac-20340 TaxID=2703888 RepID=UPI00197F0795|nr:helix-turn-helix domain-containing protein [Paraburkholderia sp. Ac-20340]MBN3857796.1 helix-turn-helix transcriptional regulator [Paraburkholderia sp. Ac-20340]